MTGKPNKNHDMAVLRLGALAATYHLDTESLAELKTYRNALEHPVIGSSPTMALQS